MSSDRNLHRNPHIKVGAVRVTCPVCGLKVGISAISPAYAGLASAGEMFSHEDLSGTDSGWFECPGSRKRPEEAVEYVMGLISRRIEAAQELLKAGGSDADCG